MSDMRLVEEVRQDGRLCPTCRAQIECDDCRELPDGILCESCELNVPCDKCGGKVEFRDLTTGWLLCRKCIGWYADVEVEEVRPKMWGLNWWLHQAVSVAWLVAQFGVILVAFSPTIAWSDTPFGSLPGVTLHGTITFTTLFLLGVVVVASWSVRDLIDRFAPEKYVEVARN